MIHEIESTDFYGVTRVEAIMTDESDLPECTCPIIALASYGHLPGCPYPDAKAEAEKDAEAGVAD